MGTRGPHNHHSLEHSNDQLNQSFHGSANVSSVCASIEEPSRKNKPQALLQLVFTEKDAELAL